MIRVVISRMRRIGVMQTVHLVGQRFLTVALNWKRIRIKTCDCCERTSIFIDTAGRDDGIRCVRCGANRRYEMLSRFIKREYGNRLSDMIVVELDPDSPLVKTLSIARRHVRTYYEQNAKPPQEESHGAEWQDITSLSFADESIDLIVSSDVLEHVPDLRAALVESARVLKKGGAHVFTVPTSARTLQRALVNDSDQVVHLEEPEYHLDPLNPLGILVFWSIGDDLPEWAAPFDCGLDIWHGDGPEGPEQRVVWVAQKHLS